MFAMPVQCPRVLIRSCLAAQRHLRVAVFGAVVQAQDLPSFLPHKGLTPAVVQEPIQTGNHIVSINGIVGPAANIPVGPICP